MMAWNKENGPAAVLPPKHIDNRTMEEI